VGAIYGPDGLSGWDEYEPGFFAGCGKTHWHGGKSKGNAREREIILDLFEEACGARLTYSYLTVGGATHDLPEEIEIPDGLAAVTGRTPHERLPFLEVIEVFLSWLEDRISEYHTLLTRNAIFIGRTAGIGVLDPGNAISFGCSGPVLRGSGVDLDLRRDGESIYTRMYTDYEFDVISAPFKDAPREVVLGDSWCRFYVRMLEVVQAIRLIRQAIPNYLAAEGSHRDAFKMNTKLPKDEAYLETECPRGQMGFYVVGNGNAEPLRARAKSSSFCNLSVTDLLCEGVPLADVPSVVGSLDVVMGEIDR